MRLFLPCLALLLVAPTSLLAQAPTPPDSPAQRAWQLGQEAMNHDRFDEAVGQFQLALRLDQGLAQAHLSLAAAYLAMGKDQLALPHLDRFLQARPDHFLVRLHFGELLARLNRPGEAVGQLERFVSEVQDHPRLADDHLVTCHTRLMEISQDLGDDYGEHLNRGIGLYLLAKKRGECNDDNARHSAEELFCKAAAELALARLRRPGEARPCWYLHGVWTQLAQRQAAVKWLRAARANARPGALTPAETRELHLAAAELRLEMQRK
jgi:tetratricopeptide (TPR) repeat protein